MRIFSGSSYPFRLSRRDQLPKMLWSSLINRSLSSGCEMVTRIYSGSFQGFISRTITPLPNRLSYTRVASPTRIKMKFASVETKPSPRRFDTVSFHRPALWCTYQTFGADHIVLGSDYPHVIGDMSKAISSVQGWISPEETRKILGENGKKILKLT